MLPDHKTVYISDQRKQIVNFLNQAIKRIFVLLVLTLSLSAYDLKFTLSSDDPNLNFKKTFIWSFTKYIEWPSNYAQGNFTIGVLGDHQIIPYLNSLKDKYIDVDGQKLEIVSFSSVSKIDKCHILYIPEDKSDNLNQVIAKLKGKSTLIITEGEGLAKQGSIINFVIRDSKIKFEINKKVAEESYSLQVSSVLSDLGILIE